jgi:glycosyltransferase involved in cell wall biosynthesis
MSERLTFAIPFYAGASYLGRALASVVAQTDPSWRCFVCDDGSGDGVEAVVRSFGDERIRYYKNDRHLGMAGNWNRCIDLAETDLVTLLHEDDELQPNYATVMLRAAAAHPGSGILYCGAEIIGPDSEPAFSFPDFFKFNFVNPSRYEKILLEGEAGVRALLKGDFIMCPTMCFRKSRLSGLRFPTEYKLVQDIELITQHLLGGGTIVGVPDVCYRYRRHRDNASAEYTRTLERFHEESAYYDRVLQAALDRGWSSCIKLAQEKRIIKLNLIYVTVRSFFKLQFTEVGRGLKLLRLRRD